MTKQISVIGLGTIGLPTACVVANLGYKVLGVDIDPAIVGLVESGEIDTSEPGLQELLRKVVQNNNLKASSGVASANIYIIAVPSGLGFQNKPDYSHLYAAVDAIRPYLREDDLVIIESTCPIGTTEIVAQKLRENCSGVHVAYCPERVLPGNVLHELIHNDRIVGGVDHASTEHALEFYQSFVMGNVIATDARTAEAVKIAENTYRDVNLAFANELSMIADRFKLDVNRVIHLANKHPRVQILKPGPGVGGHCIAVNSWFLIHAAPDLAQLTLKAREVNLKKTEWVIQKIREAIKEKGAKSILCLGLTYKADVAEMRESPALAIVQELEKEMEVLRFDPYVQTTESLYSILERSEIVVGLVAHSAFLKIPPHSLTGKVVLDFAGIL